MRSEINESLKIERKDIERVDIYHREYPRGSSGIFVHEFPKIFDRKRKKGKGAEERGGRIKDRRSDDAHSSERTETDRERIER